jgi:hypothetical protein
MNDDLVALRVAPGRQLPIHSHTLTDTLLEVPLAVGVSRYQAPSVVPALAEDAALACSHRPVRGLLSWSFSFSPSSVFMSTGAQSEPHHEGPDRNAGVWRVTSRSVSRIGVRVTPLFRANQFGRSADDRI